MSYLIHPLRLPSPETPSILTVKIKVKITLRLKVYSQSVRFGVKPLETQDQRFFFSTEPLWSWSLCNILSDEKMGLSLMNVLGFSSSVRIAHIAMLLKILPFALHQVLCQYRLCKADHTYLTNLMLQRQSSQLNGRKIDHNLLYLFLSQSHIATDGQSISKSWCRAPSGVHDEDIYYALTFTV
jgi:hypothetical protein